MNDQKIAVFMQQISKDFPGVRANDAVDFKVATGEIHGLLGENGAGKSVLMSILYGLYRPTSGKIFVHGRPASITSPAVAVALKIGMVHQHFMLVNNMTVAENVVLGVEPDGPFLKRKEIEQRVAQFAGEAKLQVSPKAIIEQMPVGARQRGNPGRSRLHSWRFLACLKVLSVPNVNAPRAWTLLASVE